MAAVSSQRIILSGLTALFAAWLHLLGAGQVYYAFQPAARWSTSPLPSSNKACKDLSRCQRNLSGWFDGNNLGGMSRHSIYLRWMILFNPIIPLLRYSRG